MPKRVTTGQRTKPPASRTVARKSRRARPVRPALLILECDPAKLAAHSLTSARDIHNLVGTLVPSAKRYFIPAGLRQELLLQLARCAEECSAVDIIVVCGHSNQAGLQLTSDWFAPWDEVAQWIAPFQPKRVVLVACQGGRWLPSSTLFKEISTLQEIFGSPVLLTDQKALLIKLLVPHLLTKGGLRKDILQAVQMANFLLTNGVIFHQTRKGFERSGLEDGVLWTAIEDLLKGWLGR
ncbi:MAG: hypothetical protein EWM73_00257 [Nitrospira sp.]|nr:MAG: hypothetical protein EWM73_00257 [Nitrospira sp.]